MYPPNRAAQIQPKRWKATKKEEKEANQLGHNRKDNDKYDRVEILPQSRPEQADPLEAFGIGRT
jgi:hypothetical protein